LLGVHSGFTEDQIDDFNYKFYKGCMKELGIKFNFESIRGLIGNSNAEDAMTAINAASPLSYVEEEKQVSHRMTKEVALALCKSNG